jgi:hypothetical protein
MLRARTVSIPMLLVLFSSHVFCQDLSKAIFAPFISRLKATVFDSRIKLTWKDSADVLGENLIYRFTDEISDKNIDKATLLSRVPSGVEFYVDAPPDEKGYYYAILLEDVAKKLYKVLIPFRNTTSIAVAVSTTATEEDLASQVTGIRAAISSSQDAIDLSFRSSNPARDLLVFWGTSPLAVPEDLLRGASKVSIDPGVLRHRIPVVQGVDYFFAVLDAGLYKVGKAPLTPGQNTTIAPVQIPLPPVTLTMPTTSTVRRILPLPSLQLTKGIESGQPLPSDLSFKLPEEKPISTATAAAIGEIMSGVQEQEPVGMQLQILESDLTPAAGGELASLQVIVSGQFARANYAEAERLIRDFLSLRRAPEVEARARYYLGQIVYFQGKPREAAMEFILAEDYFYHETQPWLDACLTKLDTAP